MTTSTPCKDMDEQLQLVHKMVDVVDRANRKNCLILLRYSVDKAESSSAQVRLFARKKKDKTFQQSVYVNYKLEEFTYLLDLLSSVSDKIIPKKPICDVL